MTEPRKAGIDPDSASAAGKEGPARPAVPTATQGKPAEPKQAIARPVLPAQPSQPLLSSSRPPRPPRVTWVAWLAAAALVGLFLAALTRRPANVAHPAPADTAPSIDQPRRDQASQMRADATTACAQSQWKRCEEKLDEARAIDPSGESDPRIARLRRAIADGTRPR